MLSFLSINITSAGFRRVPPGRGAFAISSKLIRQVRTSRNYLIDLCELFLWPLGCHCQHRSSAQT
eukprot:3209414-Alexandrium_andersonii.AAC.1